MVLSDVSRKYGRQVVLNRVTLSVSAREIIGLVGANGAGKTTLLRIACGLIRPDAGRIDFGFRPSPGALRYFGGEHTLPGDVASGAWQALWPSPSARRAVGRLRVLSRGTRQRVGLEAALRLPCPSLVILDEPWEGLDLDAGRWLSDSLLTLAQGGAGIIVSSHRIHDLAGVCSRCVFLAEGRMAPDVVFSGSLASGAERVAQLFDAFDRSRGVR